MRIPSLAATVTVRFDGAVRIGGADHTSFARLRSVGSLVALRITGAEMAASTSNISDAVTITRVLLNSRRVQTRMRVMNIASREQGRLRRLLCRWTIAG